MHKLQRGVQSFYESHRLPVQYGLLAVVAFTVAVIAGQMFYPYGKMLPGISIDGRAAGMKTTTEVAHDLERRYDQATITVRAGTFTTTVEGKHIGIEVVAEPTAVNAAEYTVSQRLIPFSFLSKMRTDMRPIVRFDDVRLQEFAAEISKKATIAPQNAEISIADDKVTVKPSKHGESYRVSDIMLQLHEIKLQPSNQLTVRPVATEPARGDAAVAPVLSAAQRIVDAPLNLHVDKEKVTVDKKTLASWITFKESADRSRLDVAIKPETVKAYLEGLQSHINRRPGTTSITLVDGQQASRNDGMAGFGVDIDKSLAMITERLPHAESTLTLPLVKLPAVTIYNRTYTATQAGLDVLAADIAAAKSNASIVVMERSGQGRQTRIAGDKRWPAASMYKIYVAYAVLIEIAAGDMQWDDSISYGKSASACFASMIVVSDNVCAVAFGDKIGWGTIEQKMRAVGLTGTSLSGSKVTTANDLALFLTKLEDGSLLQGEHRTRLLDAMKRQIYKAGIPKGAGAPAANKVGYVWGVRHDAGIVYAPGGTYIAVIMTNGLEWPSIADAARQIHTFLKR